MGKELFALMDLWFLLIVAHVFGDFLLQSRNMAKSKNQLAYLVLHANLHGIVAYLVLQQWSLWYVPMLVAVLHGLIDFTKEKFPRTATVFTLDQVAHLLSLGLIAYLTVSLGTWEMGAVTVRGPLFLAAGFIVVVFGVGYFVGLVVEELCTDNPSLKEALGEGLKRGGETIGRLERALIFLFIFLGQPAGIGFLVAAKSILRFEEAKKQPMAEYVLIGTLWSFGLAIAISYLSLSLARF